MVRFCMKKIIIISLIFITSIFSAFSKDLNLYVDKGNGDYVFLGCFNCLPVNSKSIWNEVGKYGSVVSRDSIWNEVGPYGSEVSLFSPWNVVSSHAPVLLDGNGGFYGYFTCDSSKYNRVSPDLMDFLCKNKEYIRDHRYEVYNKLF